MGRLIILVDKIRVVLVDERTNQSSLNKEEGAVLQSLSWDILDFSVGGKASEMYTTLVSERVILLVSP